jgi:hypothetical protein
MSIHKLKSLIKETLLEATARTRDRSRLRSKTLYVFDFDHTIAKTIEENIRLPDGRVDLRAFSGLSKQTKPNGRIFDLFADNVANNPTTTFILTARPPAVKEPMLEWLSEHGVDIDPENVICLGSSAGSKKRQWIKDKIIELNATKAMFWDDRESNTKAVEQLQDINKHPEMENVEVVVTLVPKKVKP